MRQTVLLRLRTHGLRYLLAAGALIIFIRWLRREPPLPDPLVVSEVDTMEFFEDKLKGDALKFSWAHAVNSQSKLVAALKSKVCGIEADVMLKNEGTDQQELLPIMAHPPDLRSDLTLRSFLHQTVLGDSIIKLDFKSIRSVELSLQIISELGDQIKVPVWLNADIVQGPGNSLVPVVTPSIFLSKVSAGFSRSTLSLGWTTTTEKQEPYSWVHVLKMFEVLKPNVPPSQRVTFAVNASLLRGSVIHLKWLCEQFDASLTIWQSVPEAPVDVSELVYVRHKFPKNRVYYDLQPETMAEFERVADDKTKLKPAHLTREENIYVARQWIIKITNLESSDLKVGDEVVWLSGPDAQLSSGSRLSANTKPILVKGAVSFIPRTNNSTYKANLQIFVFGVDHLANHPSGIRCSIDSSGRAIIAADHLHDNKLYLDVEVGESASACYQFELKISGYSLEFSVAAPKNNCDSMQGLFKPKTLKTVLETKELSTPFPIILRNSRKDGYAILEQLNVTSV